MTKINPTPTIHATTAAETNERDYSDENTEPVCGAEIFELVRSIKDPEHPLTLHQLNVLTPGSISVDGDHINVVFTPTIPHCSYADGRNQELMATLIGLSIRVKLLRTVASRFKVKITVAPGSHQSELSVNKQLNDKERVSAAMENTRLLAVVNECLAGC